VKIVKISGAGNDFVVIGPDEAAILGTGLAGWTRRVCRRGLSVGADGVLVVEPSRKGHVRVRFLNPDGAEAFCGNGSRCAARYAGLRGWTTAGSSVVLDTAAGEVEAHVEPSSVRLVLRAPRDLGPMVLDLDGTDLEGRHVDAVVPHFVTVVADATIAPLELWGPRVRRQPRFGDAGTNLDVVALGTNEISVRTWERGVEGETLACGSGAVAAALVARQQGAAETVRVVPASGIALTVGLPGPSDSPSAAILEGDARVVFEGELRVEGVEGFPV
jgi:diaminopimelate epimerase